ncbi:MAG: hypothetical protein JNL82_40230 [Myxococcales bacterium]|nr:hypothetical protein [Myxococcales bacterium]
MSRSGARRPPIVSWKISSWAGPGAPDQLTRAVSTATRSRWTMACSETVVVPPYSQAPRATTPWSRSRGRQLSLVSAARTASAVDSSRSRAAAKRRSSAASRSSADVDEDITPMHVPVEDAARMQGYEGPRDLSAHLENC